MRVSVAIGASIVLAATISAVLPASRAWAEGADDDVPVISTEEALRNDLAAVAESNGWTSGEADAYYASEREVGVLAAELAAARPDIFVGSILADDPRGRPTLLIKGPADRATAALVGGASVGIILLDGQPYSFIELEARSEEVHARLLDLGFQDVATSFDITKQGRIDVVVTRQPGMTDDSASVLADLPGELRDSIDIQFSNAQLLRLEVGVWGGMWTIRSGIYDCTSGWTVQKVGSGTRGISTAGHCINQTHIEHPAGGQNTLAFQAQHQGQWGDARWYTTPAFESDDFFSDNAVTRDVVTVEPRASISVNEYVCAYGRSSNDRDCTLQVLNVSSTCGSLSRVVKMNGDTQIGGDSGGPWFFANTAFGSHIGNCGSIEIWSVADLYDEALGVYVPTN